MAPWWPVAAIYLRLSERTSTWLDESDAVTHLAAAIATAVLALLGAAWLRAGAGELRHPNHAGGEPTKMHDFDRSLPAIRRTVVRTQLRAAASLDSAARGVLEPGQLVLVLEEQQLFGRARARVGRLSTGSREDLGWLSTETAQGDSILAPLSCTEAAAAWRWRGLTLADQLSGHEIVVAAFHQARAAHYAEIDRAPTTSAKLRHDADQLEWLLEHQAVHREAVAVVQMLRKTERELFTRGRARVDGREVAYIPPATLDALRGWYRTPVFVAPSDRISGGALSNSTDWLHASDQYVATAPASCIVVDNFLLEPALQNLVRYCRDSTVFDDFMYKGGYVGTSLTNGLGTPLVLQIATELRGRLPAVLKDHPLRHAWVYKCDNAEGATAIAPHADEAAVNVNIWLVDGWQSSDDQAGSDDGGGGLKVWLKEVPVDFDFNTFNRQPARLLRWLDNAPEPIQQRKIAHRVNRAVIFNSALVHQSDVPPGVMRGCSYENRRMNLTLLFGQR